MRQTRERCCIINNFNADRISYAEVPTPQRKETRGTPPDSPLSARSLPVSLVCTQPKPTRGRTYKMLKIWK
jgi:hypothetical protein